jgi:hypothetical protein
MLRSIHSLLPTLLWLALLSVGIWGVVLSLQRRPLSLLYLRALAVLRLILFVQAGSGLFLWIVLDWPLKALLHVVLGTLTAIFIGVLSAFVHRQPAGRAQWTASVGTLLLFALVLLASLTGYGTSPSASQAERDALRQDLTVFLQGDGTLMGEPGPGQEHYQIFCRACHGLDGKAIDMGSSRWLGVSAREDPLSFIEITTFGKEQSMPAFRNRLSLPELVEVALYAQTLPVE